LQVFHRITKVGCAAETNELDVNQWYHIVTIWNGDNCRFYVDKQAGIENEIDAVGDTLISSDGSNKIGYMEPFGYFKGSLDEVVVFDKELSDDEIGAIYDSQVAEHPVG